MDVQQVVEKILSGAQVEAEKIKQQATEEQKKQNEKYSRQIEEFKKQTDALAEKTAEEKKAHILAAARMETARQYLAEKQNILNQVFLKAKQQVNTLSDDDYLKIMTKLLLQAVETGDEEVIVDAKENRIDHDFIKMVNRQLGPGFQGNLRLSEEKSNIGAGFVLRRGKIKNNASLDVLIDEARKKLQIELAKDLFGE